MPTKEYHRAKSKEWYDKNKTRQLKHSQKTRLERRSWYEEIIKTKECIKCGNDDYRVLDWHHVDKVTKVYEISWMLTNRGKDKILEEMKKCITLCSNCHRIFHYEQDYN